MQTTRWAQRHPTAGGQGGFTLLELLVVVAVLGVLSGVVVFSIGALTDRAEQSACAADERALVTALEAHAVSTGTYGDEDALVAAGNLASTSSSHDVVLSGDGYSVVATGDCAAGSSEEVAGGGGVAPDEAAGPGVGGAPGLGEVLTATTTTLPPTTQPPTTTTAAPKAAQSISSITAVTAVNVNTNKWRATATVRVTDDLGSAVTAAGVTLNVQQQRLNGKWSDLAGASGTTNGAGVVVVSSVEVNKYPVPRIRFRVASVSAPGLSWQQNSAWSEVAKP